MEELGTASTFKLRARTFRVIAISPGYSVTRSVSGQKSFGLEDYCRMPASNFVVEVEDPQVVHARGAGKRRQYRC
jgi:hypothetical protein